MVKHWPEQMALALIRNYQFNCRTNKRSSRTWCRSGGCSWRRQYLARQGWKRNGHGQSNCGLYGDARYGHELTCASGWIRECGHRDARANIHRYASSSRALYKAPSNASLRERTGLLSLPRVREIRTSPQILLLH